MAAACEEHLAALPAGDARETHPDLTVRGLKFLQHAAGQDNGKNELVARLYAVIFSAERLKMAMIFWRLSGGGVSSRMAEDCLKHLDALEETPVLNAGKSDWEQARTVSHEIICKRIVGLLQRCPVDPSRVAQLSSKDVYLYPSGMSAIYHVHQLLIEWRGSQSIVFGFPYELTLKMVETYGPGYRFFPFGTTDELARLTNFLQSEAAEGRRPQAVWCECASNPLLRTPDLTKLRKLANRYGFVLIVDETIGSFANVDVFGVADVVVTSLTKSFSGYSNVMAGR